jgi:hypothetical protein
MVRTHPRGFNDHLSKLFTVFPVTVYLTSACKLGYEKQDAGCHLHAALEGKHKKSYSGHPVQGPDLESRFFSKCQVSVPILRIATSVTW